MHIYVRRVTICLVGRPIGAWRTDWRYTLAPSEEIMSAAAVRLRDTATGTTTPMIAVGVADCYGEDYPCLGRVLLFQVCCLYPLADPLPKILTPQQAAHPEDPLKVLNFQ